MIETPSRILVVDDEPSITEFVSYALKKEGYETDVVDNGEDAFALASANNYDLFILDIMLPGMDGYELCRRLRSKTTAPVLFLSARDTELDKVVGLEIGGDDYLAKPFGMMEMVSRIRAVLRRTARQPSGVLSCGGVTLDEGRHGVTVNDRSVSLTLKEYELLKLFLENIGQVFSREALLSRVWDADYAGETRTVDVHVKRLREKVENVSDQWALKTVWGVGYKFEVK